MTSTILKNFFEPGTTLLFTHMPRTGGDSLGRTLASYYREHEELQFNETYQAWAALRNFNEDDFNAIKCFRGHGIYHGIHHYIPRSCSYLGMLRKPVDRLVSQYYLYLNDPDNGMHAYIRDNNISLEQFQATNPNVMTNYILGFPHVHKNWPGTADVKKLEHNLLNTFCYLGVTDLYDESIFKLKHDLNWDYYVFWQLSRENRKKIEKEELPEEFINAIKSNNTLDQIAYDIARNKVVQFVDGLSFEQKEELAFYRKARVLFNKLLKNIPTGITRDLLESILQPHYQKFAIVGNLSGIDKAIKEYSLKANSIVKRNIQIQSFISDDFETLYSKITNAQGLEYLNNVDLIIGVSQPAQDYLVKELMKRLGLGSKRVIFALDPPRI